MSVDLGGIQKIVYSGDDGPKEFEARLAYSKVPEFVLDGQYRAFIEGNFVHVLEPQI